MCKKYFITAIFVIFLVASNLPAYCQSDKIILEKPKSNINVDLMTAFKMRKSTKSYSSKEIGIEDLSTILWAANGVNRPNGKRTAPTSYGRTYINLYVASSKGIYLYDANKHELNLVSKEDVKDQIAIQKYVGKASHIIVITAELFKMFHKQTMDRRIVAAHETAGCIGQNIYLITNALNVGSCYVAEIKPNIIRKKFNLKQDEISLCIFQIGYPKK